MHYLMMYCTIIKRSIGAYIIIIIAFSLRKLDAASVVSLRYVVRFISVSIMLLAMLQCRVLN